MPAAESKLKEDEEKGPSVAGKDPIKPEEALDTERPLNLPDGVKE